MLSLKYCLDSVVSNHHKKSPLLSKEMNTVPMNVRSAVMLWWMWILTMSVLQHDTHCGAFQWMDPRTVLVQQQQHQQQQSRFHPFHIGIRTAAATTTTTVATRATAAASVTTGPDGRAAVNFEEDLRLTLQIIMDHERRSTTVSKEQFVQQVAAAAAMDDSSDAAAAVAAEPKKIVDVTIPYDAAARLAYEKDGSIGSFEEYKVQYESKAVADVMAKKLGAASSSSPPPATKTVATTAVPTTATAIPPPSTSSDKSEYDVSIPYDAAAKLAFQQLQTIRHQLTYEQFKLQYEKNAVANVMMKKNQRNEE
jgi:hypothetical protein